MRSPTGPHDGPGRWHAGLPAGLLARLGHQEGVVTPIWKDKDTKTQVPCPELGLTLGLSA